jgi:hypothetical protein
MKARARSFAVAASIGALLLAAALAVLETLLAFDPSSGGQLGDLPDVVMTMAFVVVGSIVTLKRPENLVGWALSLAGLGLLAGGVLDAYAEVALLAKPEWELAGGAAAAAVSAGSWAPLMAGVFLLVVVFPEGRLPSRPIRRWTWLVLTGFALIWVGISTSPGELDKPFDAFENPLAPTDSELYLVFVIPLIPLCLLSIAGAGVRAVLRFRRSRGLERQQFKWLAASAGLLVATLPFAAAFNYTALAGVAFGAELAALPVSVGIAVLRYRLYEIDRIVSRTLVYAALTVILGAAYAGLVLAGQAAFSSFAGGGDLAIAVSTLVVAALFLPLRSRVQRIVDRRFYRRRYHAERTLAAFGARLREQLELGGLRADLEATVRETVQPAHSSLWLKAEERSA